MTSPAEALHAALTRRDPVAALRAITGHSHVTPPVDGDVLHLTGSRAERIRAALDYALEQLDGWEFRGDASVKGRAAANAVISALVYLRQAEFYDAEAAS